MKTTPQTENTKIEVEGGVSYIRIANTKLNKTTRIRIQFEDMEIKTPHSVRTEVGCSSCTSANVTQQTEKGFMLDVDYTPKQLGSFTKSLTIIYDDKRINYKLNGIATRQKMNYKNEAFRDLTKRANQFPDYTLAEIIFSTLQKVATDNGQSMSWILDYADEDLYTEMSSEKVTKKLENE